MSEETSDLIEETNVEAENLYYSVSKAEKNKVKSCGNYNAEQLIYIDSSDLVTNDNETDCGYNDYDYEDTNELIKEEEYEEEDIHDNDVEHEEQLDSINSSPKHNLILRETIDENGQLAEGYFCQQCNTAYNTIDEFLSYHPCVDILIENSEFTQQSEENLATEEKLWDLVENLDEAQNDIAEIEMKPNTTQLQNEPQDNDLSNEDFDVDTERYFCYDCQQVFSNLSTAEDHECINQLSNNDDVEELKSTLTIDNSDNKRVFRCRLCDKNYPSLRSYNNHQRWHKKSEILLGCTKTLHNVPAVCDICNTIFASEKNLKLHMKMHKKQAVKSIQDALPVGAQNEYNELSQFYCEICNKSFDQKLLSIHKNMHQNVEEYNCGRCNKQFENLPSYEIHLQMHADNMNNFRKVNTLKKINERIVAGEMPSTSSLSGDGKRKYACQYCGKEFQRPYEKVKHERVHTGEKPYECEVCGKTFRVSYSLTLHLRTHTDIRPYVCATCNKRFKQQSVYVHHMKTHVNERGYKCDICGKSFRTSVQLGGHKNIHSKPYNCTECNRPFASLYAVKIHMKTHNKCHKSNKNLKNRCNICGASYARLFALRFHIKEQHGVDVDPTQLLEPTNFNNAYINKDLDVDTSILMNEVNEANNQQTSFISVPVEDGNEDDVDSNGGHDNNNDEVLKNDADHEENIRNHLPTSCYLDETEAATQTILNTEEIAVDHFHTEEIITDWLCK